MAMIQPGVEAGSWTDPWWDARPTDLAEPPARYGAFADELVARFFEWSATPVETIFLAAPGREYIGVIVESDSGRVVGIQVDNLELAGVRDHPHWAALLHPEPSRDAVVTLISDVRALFDRFGVPPA